MAKNTSPQTSTQKSGDQQKPTLRQGQELGTYVIQELIGKGGLSTVYRAHPKGLPMTQVALKVIEDPGQVELFKEEAKALDNLDHPNIIKIQGIDFNNSPPYLVLEHGGSSLRKYLENNRYNERFSQEKKLNLILQVLDGLEHAHSKKIYHGDIKPENVVIKDGEAKLTDFNLATVSSPVGKLEDIVKNSVIGSRVAVKGESIFLFGTPGYAAPEQQDGKGTSETADIYSVGVVLYEMFTGELPRGSFRKVSSLTSTTPTWIDDIIDRALRPNPLERPSASQFIEHIKKGMAGGYDAPPKKHLQEYIHDYALPALKTWVKLAVFPVYLNYLLYKKIEREDPWCDPVTPTGLAIFVQLAAGVLALGFTHNYKVTQETLKEFQNSQNHGTIAYRTEKGIVILDPKELVSATPEIKTIFTDTVPLDLYWTPDKKLLFTTTIDTNPKDSGIFLTNPETGETKQLKSFSDEQFQTVTGKATKIDDIIFAKDSNEQERIYLKIGEHTYSMKPDGTYIRHEKIVTNKLESNQQLCPDGTHTIRAEQGHLFITSSTTGGALHPKVITNANNPVWYHPPTATAEAEPGQ